MPPPPPPPAPPPSLLVAPVSNSCDPLQGKKPAALLADIQRGAKLRKVITNDRSAPLIGEKSSSSLSGGVTLSNKLEKELKPGGGGVRVTGNNGVVMGNLFVNGLPSKPSENKVRRVNTSVSAPVGPSLPSSSSLLSSGEVRSQPTTAASIPPHSLALKSTDVNISGKPSPPPPPVQSVKPTVNLINSNSSGRDQFKTLRPMKSDSSLSNTNLKRSGSSEDFSSNTSTPCRELLTRPAFHPPTSRPSAPPPPPPSVRINRSKTPEPPPPPVVGPISTNLSNRFGNNSSIIARGEECAPPPPPRTASKATTGSVSTSSLPLVSKFMAKDSHPLDRFTFKPLSSLPPPPLLSQAHTS